MDKAEIVKYFLGKGYSLTPQTLEFFSKNQDKIDVFFSRTKGIEGKPIILTTDFLPSVLATEPSIKVLKEFGAKKRAVSVEDSGKFFNERYEKMRTLLIKNQTLVGMISINKITPAAKKFSIVAMVNKKDEAFATVEDTTGELKVFFKNVGDFDQILEDEVVGLVCERGEDFIDVKDVIWGDVPLRKVTNKTEKEMWCLFISDIHMDSKDFNKKAYKEFLGWVEGMKLDNFYIFVLGDVSSKKDDVKDFFASLPAGSSKVFLRGEIDPDIDINALSVTDPVLVGIDGMVFLLTHGRLLTKYSEIWKNSPPEAVMLNLLKKRHMNPVFDRSEICDEDLILDTVPDIFVSGHLHKPGLANYKGTTIISNGSFVTDPVYHLVNLKTREVVKKNFSV